MFPKRNTNFLNYKSINFALRKYTLSFFLLNDPQLQLKNFIVEK